MKSLIKKCIVFCMLLSIQNLSCAVTRGGMRGGGFHGNEAGRFEHGSFQHQGTNINRGNFSHNTINRTNFYGGGYRGVYGHAGFAGPYYGGVGVGLGTAAVIGAESKPYPVAVQSPYSSDVVQQQQQEINQLEQEVTELQNR